MPRFQQAMDLHRDRYIDPDYSPHFEAEDIARREARTRSALWSWYDWGLDKIFYWNVLQEAELPQTTDEVKIRRMEARIKQEQAQNRLFQEKRRALGSQLKNWHHLNQTLLDQNDHFRRQTAKTLKEMNELRKLFRFRNMDNYRHQRMLEREKMYLSEKNEASVTSLTSLTSVTIPTTDDESLSEADSMCLLPVPPQNSETQLNVVNIYEPVRALTETQSTGSLRTEQSWRDQIGQILPHMTSTVKNMILQTNKACKRNQFVVQNDRRPGVTVSSIERIFDVDNGRFPQLGVPLSPSIPILDQSGYEVMLDKDGYILTHQDDQTISLDMNANHPDWLRHDWHKSRNLVETESAPTLLKLDWPPFPTSSKSNKTNSVVDSNGNAKSSLSIGSSVVVMDTEGYELLGADREAFKAELRGQPKCLPTNVKSTDSILLDNEGYEILRDTRRDTDLGVKVNVEYTDSILLDNEGYEILKDIQKDTDLNLNANVESADSSSSILLDNEGYEILRDKRKDTNLDVNANVESKDSSSSILLDNEGYEILRDKLKDTNLDVNANVECKDSSFSILLDNEGYEILGAKRLDHPGRAHRILPPEVESVADGVAEAGSSSSRSSSIQLDESGYEVQSDKQDLERKRSKKATMNVNSKSDKDIPDIKLIGKKCKQAYILDWLKGFWE